MSTATVPRVTGYPVPATGADIDSEPVRTQIVNIVDFLEGANLATGNVDVTEVGTLGTANTWTANQTFTGSVIATTVDINGGTIDGVTIGGTTAGAITGTTITANTGIVPDADDGAYLGQSGTAFSDLFLASGGVINFNAGDIVLTHSANALALTGGNLGVGVAPDGSGIVDGRNDQNGITAVRSINDTSGTAAVSRLRAQANSGAVNVDAHSLSYTTSGSRIADAGLVEADSNMSAGLVLSAAASAPLALWSGGAEVARASGTTFFVGATANSFMTQGITISQGANDNEILGFKSTDVTQPMTDFADATTFGAFGKFIAAEGGIKIRGFSSGTRTMLLSAFATTEDTTDTTSSNAAIEIRAGKASGASIADMSATANMVVFSTANSGTVRFLIKGNGALHATNVTGGQLDGTALDGEKDIHLLRAQEVLRSEGNGIVMNKWDEHVKANKEDLKRVGVLSSEGDFINIQRMFSLQGGAMWQLHSKVMDALELLEDAIPQLKGKLLEA